MLVVVDPMGRAQAEEARWRGACSPLYCMVSKGKPMRFGSKKSFLVKSHVPSPTTKLSDEYDTAPGADSASVGAMAAVATLLLLLLLSQPHGGGDQVRQALCKRVCNGDGTLIVGV